MPVRGKCIRGYARPSAKIFSPYVKQINLGLWHNIRCLKIKNVRPRMLPIVSKKIRLICFIVLFFFHNHVNVRPTASRDVTAAKSCKSRYLHPPCWIFFCTVRYRKKSYALTHYCLIFIKPNCTAATIS